MLHPSLIERITRSLAYMLRHQPDQFDLEVDEYGFADLEDVVGALNERLGEPVEADDVVHAVEGGDRPRYEIREGRIRALYGHSIQVKPGEPTKPPDLLYVGISKDDADRARRYGLRPGRRSFLHLALTPEDALETGRRTSRDYAVIKVNAVDAWEEGINFYDRKSLFLSGPIPTHFLEVGDVQTDGYGEEEGFERGRGRRGEERSRGEGDRPRGDDERAPRVESASAPRGESASAPRGESERAPRGDGDRMRGEGERPRGGGGDGPRRREWRDRQVGEAPNAETPRRVEGGSEQPGWEAPARPTEPAARGEGDRRGRDREHRGRGEGRPDFHREHRHEPHREHAGHGAPARDSGPREGGHREGGHREGGHHEGGHREGGHREGGHREGAHREDRGSRRGPPQRERSGEGFGRPSRPPARPPAETRAPIPAASSAPKSSPSSSFGSGIFESASEERKVESEPARPPREESRPPAEEATRAPARTEPDDSGFGAGI